MIKDETLFYKKKISQIQQELEASSSVDSENNKSSMISKYFHDKIVGMLQEDAKLQVLTM